MSGTADTKESRYLTTNHVHVHFEDRLCANFVNCKDKCGSAAWYLAGAYYCDDCGRETFNVMQNYIIDNENQVVFLESDEE